MAELDFFMNYSEFEPLVARLFEEGYCFIPNMHFNSVDLIKINDKIVFDSYLSQTRYFYLTHKDFTCQDLLVDSIVKDEKTFYYVVQSHGGPYLDLCIPLMYCENDIIFYSNGYIAYHSNFYSKNNLLVDYNKSMLISHYKKISTYIKKNTRKYKTEIGRIFEISPLVIQSATKGAKLNGFTQNDMQKLCTL